MVGSGGEANTAKRRGTLVRGVTELRGLEEEIGRGSGEGAKSDRE